MKSVIAISDVWVENVFFIFYTLIVNDGGDGTGVICCENYIETANEFEKWFCKWHKKDKFFHDKTTGKNYVNF